MPSRAASIERVLTDAGEWWRSLRRWERVAVAYSIAVGLCLLAWAGPVLLLPELPGIKP
jgi:hypothetical protein